MILKRILFIMLLTGFSFMGMAQTLAHVNLMVSSKRAAVTSVDVVNNNIVYCIDMGGHVVQNSGADNNLSISYYTQFDGFDNIGKLKSIGNIPISYYTQFDGPDNIGKLKSIGNIAISYYTQFDGPDNIGKLKSIGGTTITYFDRFDLSQPAGTIKSIDGNTPCLNIISI
ncbi:hypothetical protein [Mucilaginibacter frigoritolerans]|nr:hypothetical protein [Mucilaginibacter frigoritolerans]